MYIKIANVSKPHAYSFDIKYFEFIVFEIWNVDYKNFLL